MCSVFTSKTNIQECQAAETGRKGWSNEACTVDGMGQVTEYLSMLNIHK